MRDQRVEVSLRSYGQSEPPHAHDWHQMVFPVEGALRMTIGQTTGEVAQDRAAMVRRGTRHGFGAEGENLFVVVDVPPLPDRLWERGGPFFAVDPALRHLVLYLRHEMADATLDRDIVHHLSHLLLRALGQRFAAAPAPPRQIARALEVMHRDYADPLSMREIAEEAGLAVSTFHALFRDTMRETPARYLAGLRLEQATQLIRSTGLAIAEIALMTGFADQSTLTRSMRRRRGVTPGALRRAH